MIYNGTKHIIDALLADEAVTKIVGKRIAPVIMRWSGDSMAVAYIVVRTAGSMTAQYKRRREEQSIEISICAPNYADLTELTDAVVNCLRSAGKAESNYSEDFGDDTFIARITTND